MQSIGGSHSSLYYYNEAIGSLQWSKAANYLIAVYASGVKPYASAAGLDIQNQKLVPQVFINTLDPEVAGIYQFLVQIKFIAPNAQADALINSGKVIPSTAAIPASTLAAVAANNLASQEIASNLPLSPTATPGAVTGSNNLLLYGIIGLGVILFLKKKKKKKNAG